MFILWNITSINSYGVSQNTARILARYIIILKYNNGKSLFYVEVIGHSGKKNCDKNSTPRNILKFVF